MVIEARYGWVRTCFLSVSAGGKGEADFIAIIRFDKETELSTDGTIEADREKESARSQKRCSSGPVQKNRFLGRLHVLAGRV